MGMPTHMNTPASHHLLQRAAFFTTMHSWCVLPVFFLHRHICFTRAIVATAGNYRKERLKLLNMSFSSSLPGLLLGAVCIWFLSINIHSTLGKNVSFSSSCDMGLLFYHHTQYRCFFCVDEFSGFYFHTPVLILLTNHVWEGWSMTNTALPKCNLNLWRCFRFLLSRTWKCTGFTGRPERRCPQTIAEGLPNVYVWFICLEEVKQMQKTIPCQSKHKAHLWLNCI